MRVEQGIGAVGRDQFDVGNRVRAPAVVGLAGDLEAPARHRDGIPSAANSRTSGYIIIFPGRLAWERYAAARRRTSVSCSRSLSRIFASRNASDSSAAWPAGEGLADLRSSMVIHRLRHDGEIPKSFATWAREESESR